MKATPPLTRTVGLILLIAIAVAACSTGLRRHETTIVSIVELLATPQKYAGTQVYVAGYYRRRLEASCLFLTRDDGRYRLFGNSIWVGEAITPVARDFLETTNDTFIAVRGIVRYNPGGVDDLGYFRVAVERYRSSFLDGRGRGS